MEGSPSDPSEYPAGETTVHTGYDWAQTSPTFAVLKTVSDAEGVQPTNLPSLHSSVDPDALERLLERTPSGPNGADVWVELSYAGQEVTIDSAGSVVVTPWPEVE